MCASIYPIKLLMSQRFCFVLLIFFCFFMNAFVQNREWWLLIPICFYVLRVCTWTESVNNWIFSVSADLYRFFLYELSIIIRPFPIKVQPNRTFSTLECVWTEQKTKTIKNKTLASNYCLRPSKPAVNYQNAV